MPVTEVATRIMIFLSEDVGSATTRSTKPS